MKDSIFWKSFILILLIFTGLLIIFYFTIIPVFIILGIIVVIVGLILIGRFIFWILKKVLEGIKYFCIPEKIQIEGNVTEFSELHIGCDISDISFNNFNFNPFFIIPRYGMQSDYFINVRNGVNEYTISLEKQFFDKFKENFSKGINDFSYVCKKYKWKKKLWSLP